MICTYSCRMLYVLLLPELYNTPITPVIPRYTLVINTPSIFLCVYIGIGVPAAASSGAIAANSIMSLRRHLDLLSKIRIP